jgi:heat shock protein HslJ
MRQIFLLLMVAVIALAGCNKDSHPVRQETLSGTNWVLAYIEDTGTDEVTFYPETAPRKISVTFHGYSNIISLTGICNTGEGSYLFSSQSGEVSISDLGSTKVACEYVEWEAFTIQSLNNAYRYMIDDDVLLIYSHGKYNLLFVRD